MNTVLNAVLEAITEIYGNKASVAVTDKTTGNSNNTSKEIAQKSNVTAEKSTSN